MDALFTYDGDLAERELEVIQENLSEIAKDFTRTLKNNYKITKTWFVPKFSLSIKFKSRETFEKRADFIYTPIKRKTKIGCEDYCDVYLQSFSQSLLVITQTDDFATICQPRCLYPERGARLQILTTTVSANDEYRIGKIVLSITSLNLSSLTFSLSMLDSDEVCKHSSSESVTIGSSPESSIQYPRSPGLNYSIELKKNKNSWILTNLNTNSHLWKCLTSKSMAGERPLIHHLNPNQLVHLGGSRILLIKR